MTIQPLSGIKVLDFTTLLPGPMAGLVLAEAGAEVIKIERPDSGEDMRHYAPKWGREAINFAMLNRGKKGLALNLKDPQALKLLQPLLEEADILMEQFRPGVMSRLGLSYDAVRRINPRLIYCSITGYGQSGPKADVAGHDMNYMGDAGLLSLSMGTPEQPVVPPVLVADLAGGTYPAVVNILFALLQRRHTGEGTHLDIAMTDHLFMLGYWAIGEGLVTGEWPKSSVGRMTGGSPRYRLYATKDRSFVAAAPIEQKFWQRFCELIELPEPLRDDAADVAATMKAVCELIAAQTADHWQRIFYGEDCCCSIVKDMESALKDRHFRERGLFSHILTNEEGSVMPALPVPVVPQFRSSPDEPKAAPAVGAHNDELLK